MNQFKTTLFLLSALLTQQGFAAVITPDEALNRVHKNGASSKARRVAAMPRLVHTTCTDRGEAAVYVFNGSDDNGFMILSADDQATPLLGYSESGAFNADRIPPQLEWWLSEYAAQIEYARKNNIHDAKRPMEAPRQAIEPMLKTKWDQVDPFNNQCPLEGTQRTWTGCVATSMAQVLKYFEYPQKGEGQITYNIESLEKKVTMNFAQKNFDWDNMLDSYADGQYTEAQADAVAYLMKACGYAVKMQYGLDSSGALALNIRNGLVKYLKYDASTEYALRAYYSTAQWHNMIYENLKNVGPVIYGGGSALGGGHSFVCDGYDGDGMYHFNWGWSGISDGYFSLEALNPSSLGTGGGMGGGYNFTQDAILGLQPDTGKPAAEQPIFLTQEGELTGTVVNNVLSLSIVNTSNPGWVNYNTSTLTFKFGAKFIPQGNTPGETLYHDLSETRLALEPGYGVNVASLKPMVNLGKLNLQNGTYKVVVGSTVLQRGAESSETDSEGWVEIKPNYGMPNYVTLKVDNGNFTVTDHLLPPLKITGEFTTPLYYGCLVGVKVTVVNDADVDRVSGFAPVLADEQSPLMLGESVFVNIPAHSTVTKEWYTDMTQFVQYFDPYLNTPLIFTFFDEDGYNFYTEEFSQTVTVLETPNVVNLRVTKFDLPGTSTDTDGLRIVTDPNNIPVTADMSIFTGYFAYNVMACLCAPADNDQVEILATVGEPVFMSINNRKASLNLNVCYPVLIPGEQYYMVLAYLAPGGLSPMATAIPFRYKPNSDSVDSVDADNEINITVDKGSHTVTIISPSKIVSAQAYDITGRRADAASVINGTGAEISVINTGLTIIRVQTVSGEKTFKVSF